MTETGALSALRARVFSLTWLSYATIYLTRKNFGVVKSTLHSTYSLSIDDLASIDTAYLVLYTVGQLASGALADRIGARRTIAMGMIGSALAAVAFGVGGATWIFGLAFGLQGLAQSTGWPSNLKALEPFFTRELRGRVMGLWCTCYQFGGLVGTALAAALLAFGWRMAFFVPAGIVAIVGVAIALFLPSAPASRAEPVGSDASEPRSSLLALLRMPAVWAYGSSYFGIKLIRYCLLFWLPFYLSTELHYSDVNAGYLSMWLEVGGIAGAITTGFVSDLYFPDRRSTLLAPMIALLGVALFAYVRLGSGSAFANGAAMSAVGFLLGGPEAIITGAIPQDLGGSRATASAAGLINGMGSAGTILQGVLTATIVARFSFHALFYVFTGIAFASSIALAPMALLRRR